MTDILEDIIEPNEPPREHLFYTEGGTFHNYLKKAKKINEYPGYHKLQFQSKVEFMKKDAPEIKVWHKKWSRNASVFEKNWQSFQKTKKMKKYLAQLFFKSIFRRIFS